MPSTKLSDCLILLAERFFALRDEFQHDTGHQLIITCTWRSPEEQQRLYAQGRTTPGPIVTQVDGEKKLSKHNRSPALAIDVAVIVNGKVSWDEAQYAPLGPLAKKHGLVWGGDWPTFKDRPHLELPDGR